MLNIGFMYIHKRDKCFRPVLICNVSMFKILTPEQLEIMPKMAAYLLTYSLGKINIPGKAEAFMIILDLANVSMTQMPMTALRKFLGVVQTNFRGRGFKTCITNTSMLFRGSFYLIKQMLDEFTAQKIVLMGGDYKAQIP